MKSIYHLGEKHLSYSEKQKMLDASSKNMGNTLSSCLYSDAKMVRKKKNILAFDAGNIAKKYRC